jgi:hypothetical protein
MSIFTAKKSILLSVALMTLLSSAAHAKASVVDSRKTDRTAKLTYSAEGEFEYDAANGWWWYKQSHKDKKGKTFNTKTKMSKKEKMKYDQDNEVVKLLKEQKKQLEEQNKKLKIVKERLEYAYPNITPIYSNHEKTGKECLTNSSAECFVFPLQAEAQHVPVLANWLSNPSPTNSKEWLRWESKYFNHLQKISLGNRFAFLSGGPGVYQTDTTFVYNDNVAFPMSERVRNTREAKIIESVSDKVGLMIFLGGNTLMENSLNAYEKVRHYTQEPWNKVNIVVVVPSEEAKKMILSKVKNIHVKSVQKFWKDTKIVVSANAYKSYNIQVTPSVVATYRTEATKDQESKAIWQNINIGTTGAATIRKAFIKFLVYNNIIKPVEMSTVINAAEIQKNMGTQKPAINEKDIYEDTNTMKGGK